MEVQDQALAPTEMQHQQETLTAVHQAHLVLLPQALTAGHHLVAQTLIVAHRQVPVVLTAVHQVVDQAPSVVPHPVQVALMVDHPQALEAHTEVHQVVDLVPSAVHR